MSKFKFDVGQRVCKKISSFGWDDIYIVIFNVKIAGKKFCGVLGPEGRVEGTAEELVDRFTSSVEKGMTYSVLLIPQKDLQIYREPVYVQMTREQYDRVITVMADGPELPETDTTIDLRSLEKI